MEEIIKSRIIANEIKTCNQEKTNILVGSLKKIDKIEKLLFKLSKRQKDTIQINKTEMKGETSQQTQRKFREPCGHYFKACTSTNLKI